MSTTDVGDRYVLEVLRSHGGVLGASSPSANCLPARSRDRGRPRRSAPPCGALKGRTLREAAAVTPRFPQAQENVPVSTRELPPSVLAEVERLNRELGERGRILVRPSGTEPVVRVLTEAEDAAEAEELCAGICRPVLRELG